MCAAQTSARQRHLEREGALVFVLLVSSPPFALIGAAVWLARLNWTLTEAFHRRAALPPGLNVLITLAIFIPLLPVSSALRKVIRRWRNPAGYPLPEDYGPSDWEVYKATWRTVFTGRRYRTWGDVLEERTGPPVHSDALDV